MYAGNDTFNPSGTPVNYEFATLMLKGRHCEFSLKAGNAQGGPMELKYDGVRPRGDSYNPMQKEGGLILGTGGSWSCSRMDPSALRVIYTPPLPSVLASPGICASPCS